MVAMLELTVTLSSMLNPIRGPTVPCSAVAPLAPCSLREACLVMRWGSPSIQMAFRIILCTFVWAEAMLGKSNDFDRVGNGRQQKQRRVLRFQQDEKIKEPLTVLNLPSSRKQEQLDNLPALSPWRTELEHEGGKEEGALRPVWPVHG